MELGLFLKEAIAKNIDVTIINRGNNNLRCPKGAKVIKGNLNDLSCIRGLLQDEYFDIIVDPITYNVNQLKERISIFEGHCKRYVFISSAAAIGSGEGIQSETSQKTPKWDYGVSKLQCEEYLQSANIPFEYTIIRPSITYGDIRIPIPVACRINPWTVVDRIIKNKPLVCFKYKDDHETTHNLMNVRDFSIYAVGLFDKEIAKNNDYIICSDNIYTWDEAYTSLYNVLGKEKHIYEVEREIFKYLNYNLYKDIVFDKDAYGVNYSNEKVKNDSKRNIKETKLDDGIKALVDYLCVYYKERPLEDDYNIMTDVILYKVVKNRDEYLEEYINGLTKEYKKELTRVWNKKRVVFVIKWLLRKL